VFLSYDVMGNMVGNVAYKWIQFLVGSFYGWDSAAHGSGFSLWLGECSTWQWVQFMAGTVQHMTVGSVYDWESAAHDNGFNLWLGQCSIWQWVQFMAGRVQHMTMGSIYGWDSAAYDGGFSLWLGECSTWQWVQFMAARLNRGRYTKQWSHEECLQNSESFIITSATLVKVIIWWGWKS